MTLNLKRTLMISASALMFLSIGSGAAISANTPVNASHVRVTRQGKIAHKRGMRIHARHATKRTRRAIRNRKHLRKQVRHLKRINRRKTSKRNPRVRNQRNAMQREINRLERAIQKDTRVVNQLTKEVNARGKKANTKRFNRKERKNVSRETLPALHHFDTKQGKRVAPKHQKNNIKAISAKRAHVNTVANNR